MATDIPVLILSNGSDDRVVPIMANAELAQSYQQIGGYSMMRMLGGSARRQKSWSRIATDVTGSGPVPPALVDLDITTVWTMKCVGARTVSKESYTGITVPSYRADITPEAYAIGADGFLVPTTLSIGLLNAATIGAVSGAIGYRVKYWPELTVIIDPLNEDVDVRGSEYGWSLHAEEI